MTQNTTTTPATVAPMRLGDIPQFPASVSKDASENRRSRMRVTEFHDNLHAAIDGDDVAGLRALIPGLTKACARSLIFHTRRQAELYAFGRRRYGAETWGAAPPRTILRATHALRTASLLSWHPNLKAQDAHDIVMLNISCELAGDEFWRWPIAALHAQDSRHAASVLHARERAVESAVLFHFRDDLARIHAATMEQLDAIGVPWELLASFADGRRGEEDAVAKQVEAEAYDFEVVPPCVRAAFNVATPTT
jgi:hypothetical protein